MSTNNTKLNYDNAWDIDQLISTDTTVVPSGVSVVTAIPPTAMPIPLYEVQFQVSGLSRWYQPGAYSTTGLLANMQSFSAYVQNGNIYINTTIAGTAKYFIWTDKINY